MKTETVPRQATARLSLLAVVHSVLRIGKIAEIHDKVVIPLYPHSQKSPHEEKVTPDEGFS